MFRFISSLFGGLSKSSKIINKNKEDNSQPQIVLRDPDNCAVVVSGTGITIQEKDSEDKIMKWEEITSVFIVAIDGIPVGRISWMLHSANSMIEIPTSSLGNKELLHNLQNRLPNFGNRALIEAMGMNHGFKQIWEKS